ncbi:predicted coding region AF_1762 [Archaeoglobus fulgidus DSM 4304]|jgi:1,4-dihydroxy-2-naphthoyl-CoA synthase|uniref:Uncharacterized protein AF_1762 n=3 Tax=Archaeoglobus fulgidus TaxID=2234 RepID=Y1762_ARCFU|nr:RecName: Full=Uncharacterized protein AF_1762 [Archaeoglobus fulgidus DSM 4304]AIG98763.1 hypothetical protein AFULGI_00020130 [Archaeoglobus fulgidus DSM 8774]KUJ92689.1 MAG: hypothetical protein XD40_2128 [Archaeoglobus fulgidus]MDI3498215.1 hypothetical protein [Archaeoglobus sp.]AAB89494.1 predicted coding region AF_1762 [Archaeoglobus fulgidus DSM 4304]KUK05971.1 MAG: Uncharacterized protein XD48_1806 [Archaeoglobus fulgidus]
MNPIILKKDGKLAEITLNRPEVHNMFSMATLTRGFAEKVVTMLEKRRRNSTEIKFLCRHAF